MPPWETLSLEAHSSTISSTVEGRGMPGTALATRDSLSQATQLRSGLRRKMFDCHYTVQQLTRHLNDKH